MPTPLNGSLDAALVALTAVATGPRETGVLHADDARIILTEIERLTSAQLDDATPDATLAEWETEARKIVAAQQRGWPTSSLLLLHASRVVSLIEQRHAERRRVVAVLNDAAEKWKAEDAGEAP
jgi:hypothetical protein